MTSFWKLLIAHIPDPDQFRVSASKMPEQPTFKPVRTVADVQFFSIPLLGGVPASPFYAITGLNVALAFQSDHTAGGEWAKLRTAVKRKDKSANNTLVISVGAPDRFGRCFASEEVLANFMLEFPETLQVKHLSSVVLHFWSTGQVVELLGEKPVELWPGHFEGLSPAFHPLRPPGRRAKSFSQFRGGLRDLGMLSWLACAMAGGARRCLGSGNGR